MHGGTGRGQLLLPSGGFFLPCSKPACLLGMEEKLFDLHPACRSERLPRLPGSRDSCVPALAEEVSSPGTRPRSGTAGMVSAGRELEIKGRAGSQPRRAAERGLLLCPI